MSSTSFFLAGLLECECSRLPMFEFEFEFAWTLTLTLTCALLEKRSSDAQPKPATRPLDRLLADCWASSDLRNRLIVTTICSSTGKRRTTIGKREKLGRKNNKQNDFVSESASRTSVLTRGKWTALFIANACVCCAACFPLNAVKRRRHVLWKAHARLHAGERVYICTRPCTTLYTTLYSIYIYMWISVFCSSHTHAFMHFAHFVSLLTNAWLSEWPDWCAPIVRPPHVTVNFYCYFC